ncbi:MAG: response regulator [Acidobacteriia bacterium]|nr:response regulator [Terriglobia bacterium]
MERVDTELWRAKEVARLLSLVEADRRYYQEILAILPAPVAILSKDLAIILANRAFRRLFPTVSGPPSASWPISEIVPLQGLRPHAVAVLASGIPYTGQLSAEVEHPLCYTLQPMRDWDLQSEPELLLLVQEAVAAPAQPPAAKDALAGPLDVLPGIAWEMDPRTMRFTRITASSVDNLGLPQSGWSINSGFLSPRIQEPDIPALKAFYQLALGGGPIRSCDYRSKGIHGETLWLRDMIQLVRTPTDQSPRIRGLTIDITETRRLGQFAAHSQKLEALSRLAGRVMHDCNNLIMIMAGYGEDLLDALASDDPLRASVQEILTAGNRFAGLASQLKALTTHPALAPRSVAIDSLLTTVAGELREQHPASLQFVLKLNAGNAAVHADPTALAECLRTLMQRAISAMHRGGTLTIESGTGHFTNMIAEAEAHPPPGAAVHILLSDTGPAIHPQASQQLFEPPLEGAKPAHNLMAVFQTIQESGGIISVDGPYDHGSNVRITLPAIAAAAGDESPAAGQPARTEQETILLVEDELGIRNLIRKVLDRSGYRVLEAANGREALEMAQSHSGLIHLLLTDVIMPEMNGVDLATALQSFRPETRVLFISGYTGPTGLDVANLPPGSGFLPKPFAIAALVAKVRQMLAAAIAANG